MHRSATLTELRRHPRAQLRLPARIRWHGPLGMRLEETQTIDVSREGLLFHRDEPCDAPARAWVTFPYDPADASTAQPETPASVVRVERDPGGGFRVGLRLQLRLRQTGQRVARERRSSPRWPFALPIFVRPAGTPWPEELMTLDLSRAGVRFETSQVYAAGDLVLAKIPWGEWVRAGEWAGRVVRVEAREPMTGPSLPGGRESGAEATLSQVAVQWIKSAKK
ncbi:MAG: PilZ domain-containing protein [Acidobacteriia bacterium]|nr:PilZ domain-containing protein [Terriglobia bacterium]